MNANHSLLPQPVHLPHSRFATGVLPPVQTVPQNASAIHTIIAEDAQHPAENSSLLISWNHTYYNNQPINIMATQQLNLFIVEQNRLIAASLKNYLTKKFGTRLNITTFQSTENCLSSLNDNTHVVILDQDFDANRETDMRRSIRTINPQTEVIMFKNNDEAGIAAELFRKGSRSYVTKNNYLLRSISWLIRKTVTEPIRYVIREFGVPTFVVVFLSTFVIMGLVVYFVLQNI